MADEAPNSVQVGGDADTLNEHCTFCAARAKVDAAVVRAGTTLLTVVTSYERTPFSSSAYEKSKAMLAIKDEDVIRGEGHSREEAIYNALEAAGVQT